jgi:hypothetical protein
VLVPRTSALESRFYPKFVRSLNEYADIVAENFAQDFVICPASLLLCRALPNRPFIIE